MSEGRDLAVGLDLGSTHTKAVVADLTGRVVAIARAPTPLRSTADGGSVHPAGELLAVAERVVRDAVVEAEAAGAGRDRRISALGIASVAEAGAPVDRDGRPLDDVLAWFDPRPAAHATAIAETVGAGELFRRTGLRPEAKVTLAKLAWLREREPGLMARMAGWRFVADLVAGTWTRGARRSGASGMSATSATSGTSATLACRSMAWDLERERWDAELLGLVGLDVDRMPAVLPWDQPVGSLDPAVAGRLGLTPGLPVAVAGHDHLVGGLAIGVAGPGDVLDSIGTAEAILLVTERPALTDAVREAGFSVGAHVLPDRFALVAGLQTSGAWIDWFLTALAGVAPDASPADRYARLATLVGASRRRPSGIVARPTLRGRTAPSPDATATAAFEGLTAADALPELALAALEGTAYHVRWMLDELARLSGQRIGRVRTIGGGAANEALLDVKRALSPGVLEVPDVDEAVALGAALVAAVAGRLAEPDLVTGRAVPLRPLPDPATSLVGAYDEIYRARFLPSVNRSSAVPR